MIYHQGLNEQRLSRNYRGRTSPVTYAHQFMPQNRELQQLTSTNTFTNVLPKFLKTNDIRPTNHNERNWELHHNQYTIPGTPGLDYPTHTHIPLTTFYCYNQRHPGYYADQETNCQVGENLNEGLLIYYN